MSWKSPQWLWALALLPVLAGLLVLWGRDRRRAAATYADPRLLDLTPPRRVRALRVAALAAGLLAMAFGIVALARPAMSQDGKEQRSTVVLAIDTSKSMEKPDVAPTRLAAGVEAAKRFLDVAPKETAVGFVTFDQGARVRVSPTTDRGAVRDALADLPIGEGTAIGDAVNTSLQSIQASGALANLPATSGDSAARILLLTDGANSAGADPLAAAARAQQLRVPVYTVLIGNDEGRTDQLSPTETLSALSSQTGGVFTRSTGESDLRRVYEDIGSSLASIQRLEELTVWAVLGAVASMLIGAALLVLSEVPPRGVRRRSLPA